MNSFTDKNIYKIFILEIQVKYSTQHGMNSVSNKNFYKNFYFINSSQVIRLNMGCILSLIKIFIKYLFWIYNSSDSTQHGINSVSIKIFIKIFILEIQVKYPTQHGINSVSNKNFYKIFILDTQFK